MKIAIGVAHHILFLSVKNIFRKEGHRGESSLLLIISHQEGRRPIRKITFGL
jgi:hypothetical protein